MDQRHQNVPKIYILTACGALLGGAFYLWSDNLTRPDVGHPTRDRSAPVANQASSAEPTQVLPVPTDAHQPAHGPQTAAHVPDEPHPLTAAATPPEALPREDLPPDPSLPHVIHGDQGQDLPDVTLSAEMNSRGVPRAQSHDPHP